MTDRDDILLEDFFKQAAQQEIEDKGFTERVMMNLPDRNVELARKWSRLWTIFCIIVGGVLFFVFGGLQLMKALFVTALHMLLTTLEVFVVTAPTAEISVSPWAIVLLLAFVVIYLPYQTGRKLSSIL